MEWEKWKPLYEKILKEFGYDEIKDMEAAKIAVKVTRNLAGEKEIKEIIMGKHVAICGAAMQEADIGRLAGKVIVAADETASFLLAHHVIPHMIVSDLDGNVEDIIEANKRGALAIVHAHGDNVERLKKWLPKFEGKVVLTTQSKPFNGIYNFGGFTDGDRAYCIARHFHACRIFLIGFDFENVVEKEGKDNEIKKRKLKWAERIIKWYDFLR